MNAHKALAYELRDSGYSYSMINEELGIAKSTLSTWFRDRPYVPNDEAMQRVAMGQAKYGNYKREQRQLETATLKQLGKQEIGGISERDLMMIGLGLWLGEGSKTTEQIRLANSDPAIIGLWLRWLRKVCQLSNDQIVVRMHLYADSNEELCTEYWQGITDLPRKSFRKTQYDLRSQKSALKTGKLPYGTLHILVLSNKDPEKGVRLHRRMMGWVSAILNQ